MTKVEIELDAYGTGKVLVDGVDQAKHSTAVVVDARISRPTEVIIEHMAAVHAFVDGTVRHAVFIGAYSGEGPTLRDAVVSVLAAIDAETAR